VTSVTVPTDALRQGALKLQNAATGISAVQSSYVQPHNRLDRIDGLRALAVAGVLLIHAQMLTPTPFIGDLGHYGQLGVQLFFFLSGYIINMAWERGGTTTAGFYWNRVARIAPLYYLMLVLSYIFQWSLSPDDLNKENFIWHLFFAHGFSGSYAYAGISPMWSLTSEIIFYLVFPFLNRLPTRILLVLFAGSLVFGDVDTGMAYWLTGSTAISFTPLGAFKFMLAGMIVYRHRDLFATRWAVLASGLFALVMLVLMASRLLGLEYETSMGLPKSIVLLFACPFLMFSQASIIRLALENAIARFLGITSYSIYLWQMPIIEELQERGWALDILTLTAIVIAVSSISYVLVERPFLTWFRAGQAKPATAKIPAAAVKSPA
jgi:exopolysaccharide production protein ExoZ